MSNWINRKPFIVTKEDRNLFLETRQRFNCKLCDKELTEGMTARLVYANATPGLSCGNFFVCGDCDADDKIILECAKLSYSQARKLAKQWGLI